MALPHLTPETPPGDPPLGNKNQQTSRSTPPTSENTSTTHAKTNSVSSAALGTKLDFSGAAKKGLLNRTTPTRTEIVLGSDNENPLPRVWAQGTSHHSVFYSLPAKNADFINEFLDTMRDRFPSNVCFGCSRKDKEGVATFEFHFATKAACEQACKEGINVSGFVLFASPAISPQEMLLRLNIVGLPFMSYEEINTGLRACLSKFGTVKEVVVYEERKWFHGNGHVYLERLPNYDRTLQPLTYKVAFNAENTFLATWTKMGAHCRYCKAMGHDVNKCPMHPKETRACYSCGEVGHLQGNCTRLPATKSDTSKRHRKTAADPSKDRVIANPVSLLLKNPVTSSEKPEAVSGTVPTHPTEEVALPAVDPTAVLVVEEPEKLQGILPDAPPISSPRDPRSVSPSRDRSALPGRRRSLSPRKRRPVSPRRLRSDKRPTMNTNMDMSSEGEQ